jgi:hypothetical protein
MNNMNRNPFFGVVFIGIPSIISYLLFEEINIKVVNKKYFLVQPFVKEEIYALYIMKK